MKTKLALATALIALMPAAAWAQSTFIGPQAGSSEFTLSGNGTSDKDFDNNNLGASASYGWYLSENLLIAARQSLNWVDLSNGGDAWNGSTRVAIDYHFDLGRLRPFVGVNAGFVYGDNVNDSAVAGPEAGIKFYLNPTTFLLAQVEYQYYFDDGSGVTDNFSEGSFVHTIGIGLNF